ncbi:MAG: aspartate aminotransferase family protein [Hyphomicrobiaceae bacterium]|nr:MAG: aspartate aminotransferase family protein [Hyphomicrobiaceae bacterium]
MIANRSAVLYRDLKTTPPEIVRGKGVYLFDSDGQRFLDGSASASVVGIGHGRTEIWDALAAAGDAVTFVYGATFTHPWQEQLARAITGLAPRNMTSVYFTSGGSEANETAWKLARQYFVETGRPHKYKAVARWRGYHGVTLAALSLSGRTDWRRIYSPLLLPVTHVPAPDAYRCPLCAGSGSCTSACADEIERAILDEGPETVAMFIAEPVGGTSSPGVAPPLEYFRRVRRICDKYDVLFVADEVLCGYGRCGSPFAIAEWGVEPDLITLGKAIASGYAPLAAMVVSDKVRDGLERGTGRFVHGLTYSGNPVSCFIGLKVFEIMQREGLFTRAVHVGGHLKAGLLRLAEKHAMIAEVRGRGLLYGIELAADRRSRLPFDPALGVARRIVAGMRQRGIVIAQGLAGTGEQIQLSPPFTITEAEIDLIIKALDDTLKDVARSPSPARGRAPV